MMLIITPQLLDIKAVLEIYIQIFIAKYQKRFCA